MAAEPNLDDGDADLQFDFRYAAWVFEESLLVLLLNDEGDAHVGEIATVDLRIAPAKTATDLARSVSEPFTWPIES